MHFGYRFGSSFEMTDTSHKKQGGEFAVRSAGRVSEDLDAIRSPPTLTPDQHLKWIGVSVEIQSLYEVAIVGPAPRHEPVAEHRKQALALVGAM